MHMYFVHIYDTYVCYRYSTSEYLLGSPGVLFRHLGSHPITPDAVCVCVRTHAHATHAHQTPFNIRRLFTCPNESLTLETSASHRLAGNPPPPSSTPLLHTQMVFQTPVNSARNDDDGKFAVLSLHTFCRACLRYILHVGL